METQPRTAVDDGESSVGVVPWELLDEQSASAFALAGTLLLASFVAPVGLSMLSGRTWASGVVLASLAVLAATAGLLGLYPRTSESAPRLSRVGTLFASSAAAVAVGLLAGTGVLLVGEVGFGVRLPRPTGPFVALALAMASGFGLGYLLVGLAARRSEALPRTVGRLLVGGGAVLLLPVGLHLLGTVYAVETPPWVLFPAVGLLAFDTLATGYVLSGEAGRPR